MYRHLLVPIDSSDLSIEVVGNAVGLARAVGARITFFHAAADPSRSLLGDAEILRQVDPADHAYAFGGKTRELLAKAEAAARALGVPCDSKHAVSDKPAAAIIEAARKAGCDLIFMASHGHRGKLGMALASETLSVLMNAGLPVLVSSTGEPKAPAHAIGVIRDEHRSLAAVLHAWMHALAEARSANTAADPVLMRAIVRYVQVFPLALHHPKEDEHLFKRLRERSSEVNAELDELERQHQRDHQLVAELATLVETLASSQDAAVARAATRALEPAVKAYASFLWDHMGREEGVILPAAQRHLNDADWAEIDAAFRMNRDPQFGGESDKEYRQLFSRIVNAASGWQSGSAARSTPAPMS
jgi:nucleotide-binding universal stress UspA family protein/hemerythrin-like domain-containing protein